MRFFLGLTTGSIGVLVLFTIMFMMLKPEHQRLRCVEWIASPDWLCLDWAKAADFEEKRIHEAYRN